MIRVKAQTMSYADPAFRASQGWYEKFAKRKQLGLVKLHGEADSADLSLEAQKAMAAVRQKCEQYSPEHIYNMDESGLFYRMTVNYTVSLLTEKNSVRGEKKDKNRLTMVVCTNATGSHIVPTMIIGKAKRHASFRVNSQRMALPYASQSNAWMDCKVFEDWAINVFVENVRSRTGRPVLLLIDNFFGHGTASFHKLLKEKYQVEVAISPPMLPESTNHVIKALLLC